MIEEDVNNLKKIR